MNLLYLGKYRKRVKPVIEHLKGLPPGTRVVELCFGDTLVATFCRRLGHKWVGFDINANFVAYAVKKGFDARVANALDQPLPDSDVCVIMGSLYHFHNELPKLLNKMLTSARRVIISEPVSNLSSQPGILGSLAKRGSNAGQGHETFRYNKESLLDMLKENSKVLGYQVSQVKDHGKDLIIKLQRDE